MFCNLQGSLGNCVPHYSFPFICSTTLPKWFYFQDFSLNLILFNDFQGFSLSLFLLRKFSCLLLVCHWLKYRPYPHLSLSPASLSIILTVVHGQNFAMPNRRKLSTLIASGGDVSILKLSPSLDESGDTQESISACANNGSCQWAPNNSKERITISKIWWSKTHRLHISVSKAG